MYKDNDLILRPITEADVDSIWELVYKDEAPEWKKWDAPYYPHYPKTHEAFMEEAHEWFNQQNRWAIEVKGSVKGVVSYYWEHEPSHWLEIGIVLYETENGGRGIGTRALDLWIDHLFQTLPLVRIGFTTWSGNQRMIRVGEKLGMQMEGRIRRARLYNDIYYDSIKMGMLREEWEQHEVKRGR
ncbi:GNAT family N-acetyltransferase [Atopococcus tabaci]|uniref:GNAT family N-acetyltransferase n=1 Tax=Atopococcus tabaci TaxID=269774 RepID=UPI0003F63788|nr:GNAT family protein [Atopococcus tabaci]